MSIGYQLFGTNQKYQIPNRYLLFFGINFGTFLVFWRPILQSFYIFKKKKHIDLVSDKYLKTFNCRNNRNWIAFIGKELP